MGCSGDRRRCRRRRLAPEIDPKHFLHNVTFALVPTCDFTHHNVDQVGNCVDKHTDPLAVGLWVDGAGRRANGRTPRALLDVRVRQTSFVTAAEGGREGGEGVHVMCDVV